MSLNTLCARLRLTFHAKYFKSIEMVANELGFLQKLPQKRDSLVEANALLSPEPQRNGSKLTVPRLDVSRSTSPILEPMSARLSDEEAKTLRSMEEIEDQPSIRMSARVGSY